MVAIDETKAKRKTIERHMKFCKHIIKEKNILNLFVKHLKELGVAGEKNVVKLHYLSLTSRFLDKPVSVIVKGSSGAGKSFVLNEVLKHFPQDAYYKMSAATEKALINSKPNLKHKMLIIEEIEGLRNQKFFDYTIRILLSEGHFKYETPKNSLELEGPTGLISTTTKAKLNLENENRCLSVEADESPKQTIRILKANAARENNISKNKIDEEKTTKSWKKVQRVIALSNHSVIVPYALALQSFLPKNNIRIRRDFDKIISLIKAHALLHQFNRKKNSEGNIEATMKDYSIVRKIAMKPLSLGLDLKENDTIIRTYKAIKALRTKVPTKTVSLKELTKELNIDKSTASRYVKATIKKGYIRNKMPWKKGQPFDLVLGAKLTTKKNLLPEMTELNEKYNKMKKRAKSTK